MNITNEIYTSISTTNEYYCHMTDTGVWLCNPCSSPTGSLVTGAFFGIAGFIAFVIICVLVAQLLE